MSARKVTCPKCQQAFGLLERQLGSDVYCPHCGQKIRIEAPKQPEAATADALQLAAAQQLAEAPRQTPMLDSVAVVTPRATDRQGDAAADALAALGGAVGSAKPSKPSPSAAARPDKAAQGKAGPSQGVHGREIRTMADMPMVKRGPNPTVVWVALGVVVLAVIGLIVGIFWVKGAQDRQRIVDKIAEDDREKERNRKAAASEGSAVATVVAKGTNKSEGTDNGSVRETATQSDSGEPVQATANQGNIGDPLSFHVLQDDEGKARVKAHTDAKRVLFGYCENLQNVTVRKVQMTVMATKGEATHHSETFTFRDVKPKEKVWFAFEYPYAEGVGFKQQMTSLEPEAPEFVFDVSYPRTAPDGRYSGVVSCSITNRSAEPARKVAVFALLKDLTGDVSGYAKGEVVNINPGETVDAKLRWDNWFSDGIQQAQVRAQLIPQQ
jgi:DNA-directed RNA polymerase subunit RPC12/RpoP